MVETMLFVILAVGWWPCRVRLVDLSPLRTLLAAPPLLDQAKLGTTSAAAVLIIVLVGLVAIPVLTVVCGLAFGAAYFLRVRTRRQRASAEAVAALPTSLELCNVVLGAGGTIFDCLRTLAIHGPEPVRSAAQDGIGSANDGARLDVALHSFQDRLGLSFQPLTGALLLAWQGGSVGVLLNRLTTEANAGRRRLGDLRARRLPVLLLIPLVVFALPAVLIGAVVPIVVVGLRHIDF